MMKGGSTLRGRDAGSLGPQDARFTKNVLVAPGLTVKSRLGVLEPPAADNYYEAFNIVPAAMLDKLRQGKVLIRNWHTLAWDSEDQVKKRRSVDKRSVKSDEAYTREVLGEMASARNPLTARIVRSRALDRGPCRDTWAVLVGGTTTVAPRAPAAS